MAQLIVYPRVRLKLAVAISITDRLFSSMISSVSRSTMRCSIGLPLMSPRT